MRYARVGWPPSLDELRRSLRLRADESGRGRQHDFTIIETGAGRPIGSISIRPDADRFRGDIGIWIGEPYQGRGRGSGAIAEILNYGFESLGLEKIEAGVFVGNWPSRRVCEKNGFLLEGTIRKAVRKRGRPVDEWLLGITREEWLQQNA